MKIYDKIIFFQYIFIFIKDIIIIALTYFFTLCNSQVN